EAGERGRNLELVEALVAVLRADAGARDLTVTVVQTGALPLSLRIPRALGYARAPAGRKRGQSEACAIFEARAGRSGLRREVDDVQKACHRREDAKLTAVVTGEMERHRVAPDRGFRGAAQRRRHARERPRPRI